MTSLPRIAENRGGLWFGLLGGAIAWTVHLLGAYGIAEFGCIGRLHDHVVSGISLVAWLEIALTAAMTLVAAVATAVAYRRHAALRLDEPPGHVAVAAARHTAWAGVLTSGLFTFIILFESIPILYYLQDC
jgi:hypothetical protein